MPGPRLGTRTSEQKELGAEQKLHRHLDPTCVPSQRLAPTGGQAQPPCFRAPVGIPGALGRPALRGCGGEVMKQHAWRAPCTGPTVDLSAS